MLFSANSSSSFLPTTDASSPLTSCWVHQDTIPSPPPSSIYQGIPIPSPPPWSIHGAQDCSCRRAGGFCTALYHCVVYSAQGPSWRFQVSRRLLLSLSFTTNLWHFVNFGGFWGFFLGLGAGLGSAAGSGTDTKRGVVGCVLSLRTQRALVHATEDRGGIFSNEKS